MLSHFYILLAELNKIFEKNPGLGGDGVGDKSKGLKNPHFFIYFFENLGYEMIFQYF